MGAIIAVASGKGGVGKSTTAVNLALGLAANGLKVGILDADIYGPSMPRLLGLSGRPETVEGRILKPMENYGIKVMSMGFMVDEETPMIWRGPMVMSALTQMLREVAWGELDVLVVDMPPGTGDAQLTMAQQVPLAGAVVVSTPQDLALIDARKGFMVDEETPMIWRGPMVMSALTQMLREVAWGELDVLVVDMPPGTGDAQLTMAQQVPLAGAVVVSTPQDLALIDARKGLNMFRKVDVPLLGIVENMSYFIAPDTGTRYDIFGHGGARREAERLNVPFLGEVPLHMDVRAYSDNGTPITVKEPDSEHAKIYRDIARKVWENMKSGKGAGKPAPEIVFD
ncbi:ATPase [Brucella ceti TE28753-12]|nr:ATPase [Brucella ceti TE10759-12]AHB02709.1 ATPase [Brucella ceti TE28753-12]